MAAEGGEAQVVTLLRAPEPAPAPTLEVPEAPLSASQRRRANRRGYRMRRVLAVSDAIMLLASVAVLELIELTLGGEATFGFPVVLITPLITVPAAAVLWFVIGNLTGSYHIDERRIEHTASNDLGGLVLLSSGWAWGIFLIQALTTEQFVPAAPTFLLWVIGVPAVMFGRTVGRHLCEGRAWYQQGVMIVGNRDDAHRVSQVLGRHPEYGLDVVATLDLDHVGEASGVRDLIDAVHEADVSRAIFASSYEGLDEKTGALRMLADEGIKVDLVPGDSEVFRSDAELHFIEGLPILTLPTTAHTRVDRVVKRTIDVAISAAVLVLLSPLLIYFAARTKRQSPGAVLFKQTRTGQDGVRFEVLKFRTMYEGSDKLNDDVSELTKHDSGLFKIVGDPRVTPFGAKLRRLSLDELPQLVNVLRGEMSLVGPRPLPVSEAAMVADHYRARFDVRPGITGPWQVLGRSDIPFEKMIQLDYAYVVSWSVSEDLKLLMRTASAMVHGRGAY
ncbi:hypothetical protein BH10ACT11_BH10ACT11_15510 [soil metagenome]